MSIIKFDHIKSLLIFKYRYIYIYVYIIYVKYSV